MTHRILSIAAIAGRLDPLGRDRSARYQGPARAQRTRRRVPMAVAVKANLSLLVIR